MNMQLYAIKQKILQLLEERKTERLSALVKKWFSFEQSEAIQEFDLLVSQMSSTEDAILLLRLALQRSPRTSVLYVSLVRCFFSQQNLEQASYWCQIGLKIDPQNGQLWAFACRIAFENDQMDEAKINLQRAHQYLQEESVFLSEIQGELHMRLAELALQQGEQDRALFWLRRASLDTPAWEVPRQRMAEILHQMGRPQSAARYHSSEELQEFSASQQSMAPGRE